MKGGDYISTRARVWTFVIYDENKSYMQICDALKRIQTQIALSPRHRPEPDEDGYQKKSHFHGIINFSGNKSASQLYSLFLFVGIADCLAGYKPGDDQGNIERCFRVHDNKIVAIRYLIHADQPEKEQFEMGFSSIKVFGGFDITAATVNNYNERFNLFLEIVNFCKNNGVWWYHDLVDYAYSNNKISWLNYLNNNSYNVQQYLQSYAKKQQFIINQREKELTIRSIEAALDSR